MCCGLDRSDAMDYGNSKICCVAVAPHALYQVNRFVTKLDRPNYERNGYELGLLQRMEGRIIGTLGYAAVIVAALVENIAILAIALLVLLPSLLFKDGIVDVLSMAVIAVMTMLDIPVRALSGFVQNVLFFQGKSFKDLDIVPNCIKNFCTASSDVPAEPTFQASTASQRLAGNQKRH